MKLAETYFIHTFPILTTLIPPSSTSTSNSNSNRAPPAPYAQPSQSSSSYKSIPPLSMKGSGPSISPYSPVATSAMSPGNYPSTFQSPQWQSQPTSQYGVPPPIRPFRPSNGLPISRVEFDAMPPGDRHKVAQYLHLGGNTLLWRPTWSHDDEKALWIVYNADEAFRDSVKSLVESKKSIDPRRRQ